MNRTILFLMAFITLMSATYADNSRKTLMLQMKNGLQERISLANVDSICFSTDGEQMVLVSRTGRRIIPTAQFLHMKVEEGEQRRMLLMDYLRSQPVYSEYVRLLQTVPCRWAYYKGAPVSTLLEENRSEGYTCFAPTNEAVQLYLQRLTAEGTIPGPSWERIPRQTLRDSIQRALVYNSIISCACKTRDFPRNGGEFYYSNENNIRLVVTYEGADTCYINGACMDVVQCDVDVANGVVHQMRDVIESRVPTAANFFERILDEWWYKKNLSATKGHLVTARVLAACGLMDTLRLVRDEEYEMNYFAGRIEDNVYSFVSSQPFYSPQHRAYGFTVFIETDDFWRAQGIDPAASDLLPRLVAWIKANKQYVQTDVFTTDANYRSEKNLLYQWMTYHMLPMRITPDRLVFHDNEYGFDPNNPTQLAIPVTEYYTTMGPRRLLKVTETSESRGVCLNRFPLLDNGRNGTGREINCDMDKEGCKIMTGDMRSVTSELVNACIYPIDAPLSYTDAVRDNLAGERLRFDVMSLFPEAMNSGLRRNTSKTPQSINVYIPHSKYGGYAYFENMYVAEDYGTQVVYFNTWQDWNNLYQDEMNVTGMYDVVIKLPPVPKDGEYELRYSVLGGAWRDIMQIYFGTERNSLVPIGVPIDCTITCRSNPNITGWKADTGDDELDAMTDHAMRNRGFMKGAKSITNHQGKTQREEDSYSRRILVRQTMHSDQTYYIRFKSVQDSDRKALYLDYFELCPKSVYDNPLRSEDIW